MVAASLSLLVAAAFPGLAAPGHGDPLAAYRGQARVLVVLADDAADPDLARQREIFAAMKGGADERDLALVEAIGNDERAHALRQRFGLADRGFSVVLVGKDAGGKLTAQAPLGPAELFPLIDAMPMRQDEMRRK